MTCDPYDVVEVPFPFSDSQQRKIRKALVLSNRSYNDANQASILAMITSARAGSWLGDVPVSDLKTAGLKKSCVVRLKIFTLDNAIIMAKAGSLSEADRKQVKKVLREELISNA